MANEVALYFNRDISQSKPYKQYMEDLAGIAQKQADLARENSDREVAAMRGIETAIGDQTYLLLASQNALKKSLGQGFDSVNNTLTWGFQDVTNELGVMSSNMSMGFALTAAAIDKMSMDICDRLDAISGMLSNPRRTEVRELYRHALNDCRRGFFKEALPDIQEAIKKEKTDSLLWFLKGQIYAFGAGKTGSLINLDEAIDAYTQAEIYKPDTSNSKDAKQFAAEICFYLGLAQYSKSNELLREGDKAEAEKLLASAKESFEQSYRYSDGMLESLHHAARCKVLLKNETGALSNMKTLIKQDWTYYIKACGDTDFAPIYSALENLLTSMRDEEHAKAAPVLNDIAESYKQAQAEGLTPYFSGRERHEIEECLRKGLDKNLPYVDMKDRYANILEVAQTLENEIRRARTAKAEAERAAANAEAEAERKAAEAKAEAERRAANARAEAERIEKERREEERSKVEDEARIKRNKQQRRLSVLVTAIIFGCVGAFIGGLIPADKGTKIVICLLFGVLFAIPALAGAIGGEDHGVAAGAAAGGGSAIILAIIAASGSAGFGVGSSIFLCVIGIIVGAIIGFISSSIADWFYWRF